jgi:hypothetical protein
MTDPHIATADRRLPLRGEIFLDHVAHFVADPESAGRALARAGFAPTPVSVQVNPDPAGGPPQPTGTGNVTCMLDRGYLEILFKTSGTPLSRELDVAMARYRGVHLAAFAVADAAATHARLGQAGFHTRPLVNMQRPVETAAGEDIAAFSVVRLVPGEMPEGRIQALTHHTEPMVWQPRWLAHPNGAIALTGIFIAVADVEEAAARFARFTGRQAALSRFGHTIALDRGRIELMSGEGLQQMLPEISMPSLPFMAGCEIKVTSLARLRDMLERAGMRVSKRGQSLVVGFPPEIGQGAWLFFE